jgi:beta-lactamase superfamily II metal-dependent hydrolase
MKQKAKYIKYTLLFTTIFLMAACFSNTDIQALANQETALPEVSISINGEQIQFNEPSGRPFLDENNRVQVPFRQTLEAFGAEVEWDSSAKTAIAKKGEITVKVPIGEDYIYKNGVKVANDTNSLIQDERTYLPIRIVLEAFGATVSWEAETQTVIVVTTSSTQPMTIHFIDVAQGDAIFIDYGEYEILIDAGVRKYGKIVSDYIRPMVDGPIELVIATHPDADHIAGLIDVISEFDIDTIYYNGEIKDTATYREFYNVASTKNNCELIVPEASTIKIDDFVSLQIIPPIKKYSDTNENSIVAKLTYGDISVLFTGDMEKNSEKDLMSSFTKANVLKAAHHGSRTSSTAAFLNIIKPEYVIILCGKDKTDGNSYSHPHTTALERYLNLGAIVYGTYRDGTIIMETDGKAYSFSAKTPLTLSDAGDKKEDGTTTTVTDNISDSQIDGEIKYIGNKSSKKFHYPSCTSVEQIGEKNIINFYNISETAGYSPCGICKPI